MLDDNIFQEVRISVTKLKLLREFNGGVGVGWGWLDGEI